MCGIAAILLYPQERSASEWEAIRACFTRNLLFNEDRGRAATGIAAADLHGSLRVYKSASPASRFTTTAGYHRILESLSAATTLVLGHTRLPTKGAPHRNRNNHPIEAGSVVGVHNGDVTNDDELFARGGYARSAETDSEIIFRLIESIDPLAGEATYMHQVRRKVEAMQGQYTFVACDRRRPSHILVLRHGNPLCMHFERRWNALVFSSRYVFLRSTFGRDLLAGPLEHDRLMLFDAMKMEKLGPRPSCALELRA